MVKERFGTERPDGKVAIPDLIFVPMLAFDKAGNRLGYGGGYYDRTLASYGDTQAVGFCYAALRVDNVPAGPHDRPLKTIFTEHGIAVDRRPT
jgi:5-formyltetrahydrofolate cyclo-ligase